MADLILKYRLIWDISTLIIQNDYEIDHTGSLTRIINSGDVDFIESDTYQDVLDKIIEEDLKDPSIN